MRGCVGLGGGLSTEAGAESDCSELLLVNNFVREGMRGGGAGRLEEKDPVLDEVAEAVVAVDVVEVKDVAAELVEAVIAKVADTVVEGVVVVMGGGEEALILLSPFSWNLLLFSVSNFVCTGGILLCLGRAVGFGLLVFCCPSTSFCSSAGDISLCTKTLSLIFFSGWHTEALVGAPRDAMFFANTGSTSCLLMDPKSSLLYDRRCQEALNGEELLERWCAESW